ncbi:hypothetical protein [Allocoleopsis franciscana]|uniref:hypothetical protein n=1 Tax=Allocoleopsis franciscana TaxID=2886352 RepID=UPI00031DC295|nr:hypothetical protein [Allocoleopsis franciscana]
MTDVLRQALRMEFWGYTNQVRRRSFSEDGLTEYQGFYNLRRQVSLRQAASRLRLYSCGFNRQVQALTLPNMKTAIASSSAISGAPVERS